MKVGAAKIAKRRKPAIVLLIVLFLWLLFLPSFSFQPFAQQKGPSPAQKSDNQETAKLILPATLTKADPAITEFPIPQNNSVPVGITTDSHGNVWFAENNAYQLVEYTPSKGTFTDYPIPMPEYIPNTTPPTRYLPFIWFLIFDKSGDLWFNDASSNYIWRFSPSTGQFANFSTGYAQVSTGYIPVKSQVLAYDPKDQTLWFSSPFTDQIGYFNISADESLSQPYLITVPKPSPSSCPPSETLVGPVGLAIDPNGNLFATATFDSAIEEYSPSTQSFVHMWVVPGCGQPTGLAFDSRLNLLWFTNHATSLIGYVNMTNGVVRQISTSLFSVYVPSAGGSETITLPYWIQQAPDAYIWFNEHIGNKIARLNPLTMQLTEFAIPTNTSQPLRFAIDNQTGLVWFTEFQGNNLGVLDENQSATFTVVLSGHNITLAETGKVIVNFPSSQAFAPLVSGSLSVDPPLADGSVNSNISITTSRVNSSAFSISIGRTSNLTNGEYTLTICPTLSASDSPSSPPPVRSCAVTYLTVVAANTYSILEIVLIVAVVGVISAVSLLYVRRWRRE
jgi:virginiamycin B lyase